MTRSIALMIDCSIPSALEKLRRDNSECLLSTEGVKGKRVDVGAVAVVRERFRRRYCTVRDVKIKKTLDIKAR